MATLQSLAGPPKGPPQGAREPRPIPPGMRARLAGSLRGVAAGVEEVSGAAADSGLGLAAALVDDEMTPDDVGNLAAATSNLLRSTTRSTLCM